MPFDSAKWQILLGAEDTSAAAFNSLQQRMRQTQIVSAGVTQGMNLAFSGLVRLLGPLSAAYLATAAAQKVWAAGMKAADMGEQAEQIGLTTSQLQAYRLEAAQNGVSTEQLDGAMMKLARSMGEANSGSADAIERFDKLGVKLLDANGELRKTSDVMPELARGLLSISSETERNALMMEIFGRSGTRMVTMLKSMADGNEELERKARAANAMMSGETIKIWDEVSDQMKVAQQRSETLWAQLSAPIALEGLKIFNSTLRETEAIMLAVERAGRWLSSAKPIGGNMENMQAEVDKLQKSIAAAGDARPGTAAFAALERDKARLGVLQREMAAQTKQAETDVTDKLNRIIGMPAVPPPVFLKQPKPKDKPTSAGSGDNYQKKLDALMVERKALEDALSKMELRGDETVAEMDKRLDREVALQKRLNSLTEGLPKDSAMAEQLREQATAVADLNQRLDDKKRILQEAEQTIAKYGDGTREAARATKELDEQLREGAITPEQHAAALRDVTLALQEQQIAVRGRNEGFDAFTAGMEKMITQSSKLSRSFQYGEKFVQLFDDAIAQLVQNGEINFNRLLGSFIQTIAQMEMRAAASSIWSLFGGSGGGGGAGGLIGSLITGAVSLFAGSYSGSSAMGSLTYGSPANAPMSPFYGGPKAAGGPVSPQMAYLVGENGPEIFQPNTSGRIIPNGDIGGDSGDPVVITMNNNFSGGVTHAEMLRFGAMIEERARAGAMAGIEAKRKRGGSIKQVFRG